MKLEIGGRYERTVPKRGVEIRWITRLEDSKNGRLVYWRDHLDRTGVCVDHAFQAWERIYRKGRIKR